MIHKPTITRIRRVNSTESQDHHGETPVVAKEIHKHSSTDNRFDFEARQPWYLFSKETEHLSDFGLNAVTIPIIGGQWMNGTNRLVQASIDLHAQPAWSQVALHVRLTKPPHQDMKIDRWDREGSVGLFLNGTQGPGLRLIPAPVRPRGKRRWDLTQSFYRQSGNNIWKWFA